VYKHPTQGYEAVKHGTSWPALFFTVIWAFVKKIWWLGFALIGAVLVFEVLKEEFLVSGTVLGIVLLNLTALATYITVAVKGNDWRRDNLVKRGFKKSRTLEAWSPSEAIDVVAAQSS